MSAEQIPGSLFTATVDVVANGVPEFTLTLVTVAAGFTVIVVVFVFTQSFAFVPVTV